MDDHNKQRIQKMAAELFTRFGIRSVSMDDIAHHLGMSKKTIYQHFADKDEIVTESIRSYLEQEKDTLRTIQQRTTNAIEFLVHVNHYLRRNVRETTASIVHELRKYHNNAWRILESFRKEFLFEVISENLRSGIEDGYFRPEINPEVVSRLRLEEASMAFDEDIFPKTRFNLGQVSDCLMDHFVLGIATEKGRKVFRQYKTQVAKNTVNNLYEV